MNATAILEALDPNDISARLDELRGEQKALRTLLRAARARCQAPGPRGREKERAAEPAPDAKARQS